MTHERRSHRSLLCIIRAALWHVLAVSLIYIKLPVGSYYFQHKCHFLIILRWALQAKTLKERGSLNAVFSFANTAHQVFLIKIRVFQI